MAIPLEPHTMEAFPESTSPAFVRAPEVEDLARRLIARHHELRFLRDEVLGEDPTIALEFVFDTKAFDPAKEEITHATLGKATKAPPLWMCLTDNHAVIAIREWFWRRFTERQRSAVLFHELLHLEVAGPGKVRIAKHSLEEFTPVVRRYGAYLPDRAAFLKAFSDWRSDQPVSIVDEAEQGEDPRSDEP